MITHLHGFFLFPEGKRVLLNHRRITSTKSPSYCMTIFSASLTNLTALLFQSRDCSYYVSRRILALPPLWLQKHTYLRAHEFAHSPDLWHQPRRSKVTCIWGWRLCGINHAIIVLPWSKFLFIILLRLLVSVWSQILCVSISAHYAVGLCDICCHLLTPSGIHSIVAQINFR